MSQEEDERQQNLRPEPSNSGKTHSGRHFGRVVLGIPVFLLYWAVNDSSCVEGASIILGCGTVGLTNLLILTIVCTAGIGGFFWIGLFYILGFIVEAVFTVAAVLVLPRHAETPGGHALLAALRKLATAEPSDEVLGRYLILARRERMRDQDIAVRLREAGWSAEEVASAFATMKE